MKNTNSDQPNPNLQKALENLETFSQQVEKELLPNLSHFEVQEGKLVAVPHTSLKKTISLAYSNLVLPGTDERSEVLNEILHSSDIIKSYLPLIMREGGTSEQKKFAAYAKRAIERFNQAIDKTKALPPTWQKRIVRFLYQKSGLLINRLVRIELPQKAFLHVDFPHQTSKASSKPIKINSATTDAAAKKISNLREMMIPAFQVEKQTLELYHMKVIALVERHQLLSNFEARMIVVNKPIQIELDKQEQLLTISQTLAPLPGQQIDVSVTFKKDPRTLTFSIFVSDNLSLKSTQTGYPKPEQHHGWALSEKLIPEYLHRPNLLNLFPKLNAQKIQIAQDLLPNGPLVEKARMFLRLKRQTFNKYKLEFLDSHRKLAFAIAEAAPKAYIPNNFIVCTNQFFDALNHQSNPYDLLSNIYDHLMRILIVLPHAALERSWLNGNLSSYDDAQQLLSTEMFANAMKELQECQGGKCEVEKFGHHFQVAMQQILAPAIQQLLLQQQSEIMEYIPPKLDLFSKKLQTAVYLQLWEFHHELSLDPHECDLFRRLSRLLEDDITLFKANSLSSLNCKASTVTIELEAYYIERTRHLG